MVPALLCSQTRIDSFYTPYDSIQDLFMNRMENRWEYQLKQTEERLMESIRLSDSLMEVLDGLKDRVGPLEADNMQLKERTTTLQTQLNKGKEETEIYKSNLKRVLWIGSMTLLFLLLASFLFLLFYSLRTRSLLGIVQSRLKRLRKAIRLQKKDLRLQKKDLSLQKKDISKIPVVKKKRIRRIAAAEVTSKLKDKKLIKKLRK